MPKKKLKTILKEMGNDESEDESLSSETEQLSDDMKVVNHNIKKSKPPIKKKQSADILNRPDGSDGSDGSDEPDETSDKPPNEDNIRKIKKILKPTVVKSPNAPVRGPGRPRKNPIIEPIPKLGISNKPSSKKNKMELLYGNPQSFKKIFALLKAMSVEKIYMTFTKKSFTIQAVDHLQKSNIFIQGFGDQMNRYYCEDKYTIVLDQTLVSTLFHKLNNSIHAIKFISPKKVGDDVNIYVVYTDRAMEVDYSYIVPLEKQENMLNVPERGIEADKYPVKFTFDSKYFKNLVNNMALSAKKFLIQKHGNGDFRITYSKGNNNGLSCNTRYKNPEKIKLESKIGDNEMFSVPINIKYIKPLAKAQISDDILICADPKQPTIFISDMDKDPQTQQPAFRVEVRTKTFEYQNIKE